MYCESQLKYSRRGLESASALPEEGTKVLVNLTHQSCAPASSWESYRIAVMSKQSVTTRRHTLIYIVSFEDILLASFTSLHPELGCEKVSSDM